jgi:peroxiredoxin
MHSTPSSFELFYKRTTDMNRRHLCQTVIASCLGAPAWLQAAGKTTAQHGTLLSGTTLQGNHDDLKQDAGKVVLVFFWSTECAVCRDKLPELRLNFQAWRDKGFQLVGISLDKSLKAVSGYQAVLDSTTTSAQRFPSLWRGAKGHRDNLGAVVKTPTTFVLDRQHKIVNEIHGRIAPSLWDDIADLVSG